MSLLERTLGLHWLSLQVRPMRRPERLPPLPPGVVVRLLGRGDLLEAAKNPRLDLSRELVERALDRGDICVGALCAGEVVAYLWRAFGLAPTTHGLCIEFGRPYRYGYKGFTLAEWRGKRLQEALALSTDELCLARGFTRGVSYIATHNFASLASSRRIGEVTAGYLGFFTCFGRAFPFRSPGARRIGVRLVRAGCERVAHDIAPGAERS